MAPGAYGADALVLGGDIVGRSLIAITSAADGYAAQIDGHALTGVSSRGLDELTRAIRRRGDYYVIGGAAELERLSDATEFQGALRTAIRQSAQDWVTLAEERLRGSGVRCFVVPGGQDPPELDAIWGGGESVVLAGDGVVSVDGEHQLLSVSCATPTPFKEAREVSELQMRSRLESAAAEVRDMGNAVLVVHTPPYGCALDQAPLLDENLCAKAGMGRTASVGSIAVRDFIEAHQPLVAAHGQVHERNGTCRIANTLCVNPGSRAGEGELTGALLDVGDRSATARMLVAR
jgi:uncharacterized protein